MALHCIALHCIALHCIALHCIALHCIALHCITSTFVFTSKMARCGHACWLQKPVRHIFYPNQGYLHPLLQNYQVDWEAILARSPEPFVQSVSPWLYPPAARETPLQSSPSGQGLTADSARIEDPLAEMSTGSMDGIGNGSIPAITKAAPPITGLQMQPSLFAIACTNCQ